MKHAQPISIQIYINTEWSKNSVLFIKEKWKPEMDVIKAKSASDCITKTP